MPLSLRISAQKGEKIKEAAAKSGKTKTAYILEAVDEKLGLVKSRQALIREMAGWMTRAEANALRQSLKVFEKINEGDWN